MLGMINFYRRYIPNCAEVIAPLTELTKNRAPNNVEWGAKQERVFKEVKKILSSVRPSICLSVRTSVTRVLVD